MMNMIIIIIISKKNKNMITRTESKCIININ